MRCLTLLCSMLSLFITFLPGPARASGPSGIYKPDYLKKPASSKPARPMRPHGSVNPRGWPREANFYPPYISGFNHANNGRVTGYHVVAPAIEDNPFGGLQGTVNSIRTIHTTQPAAPVVLRRYKLAPPPVALAEQRETTELSFLLQDPNTTALTVHFTEAQLLAHALPLLQDMYRAKGLQLVPAYELTRTSDGTIQRRPLPEATLPVPSADLLRDTFRAGRAFTVLRPRQIKLTCGLCEGKKEIPTERLTADGQVTERILTGKCPRCAGRGSVVREVQSLYTILPAN